MEVAIADPIKDGEIFGFAYLFVSQRHKRGQYFLRQDAGQQRVSYNFNLTTQDGSNSYFDAYKFNCDEPIDDHECRDAEMNPEDSWFKSPTYMRHFGENWYIISLS